MYVPMTSRPDIAAATCYYSRFQNCSTDEHFMYAKRILRYIKGTLDVKLVYDCNSYKDDLHGFADADWAGYINGRRSTSGYVFNVF